MLYLEVIRDVVLAAAWRAAEQLLVSARAGALVGGGGLGEVVVGLLARGGLVLGGRHGF